MTLGPISADLTVTRLHNNPPDPIDAALAPFVRQFAETDRAWFDALPLPAVQRWLAAFLASPMFAAIMVRWPVWQAEDAEVLFPQSSPSP